MITANQLQTDFNEITNLIGTQVRIRTYDITNIGSYYDDDVVITKNSDIWTSGVIFSLDETNGSSDAVLVEQGRLKQNDSKLYIEGDINTSGAIKVGFGSRLDTVGIGAVRNFIKIHCQDFVFGVHCFDFQS